MVATVIIDELNGAGATETDKTGGTIRMKNADNATVDSNNPMVVPSSGTDWSFEKWLRLEFTVAPAVQISNMRAYFDGAIGYGTGINLFAKAVTAFATPAEGTASTGYVNVSTLTSGAPLVIGSSTYTGTGLKGDHVVLLASVADTASQGAPAAETITFAYDEI